MAATFFWRLHGHLHAVSTVPRLHEHRSSSPEIPGTFAGHACLTLKCLTRRMRMWTVRLITAMSLVLSVVRAACAGRAASSPPTTVSTGDYTIAAPVQHENLTLFL